MQNPSKSVMELDDRPKGRSGIEEMLERMDALAAKETGGDPQFSSPAGVEPKSA